MIRRLKKFDGLRLWSFAMAFVAIGAVLSVVLHLLFSSGPLLFSEGVSFLTGADWSYREASWGALSMIFGTVIVSTIALAIAVPCGLGSAIYISEMAGRRSRVGLKMLVELLAGVPSVVYGLLGLAILRPAVLDLAQAMGFDVWQGDTLLTGGLLLSIMILPTMTTFSEDALAAVSRLEREAARGLGMTRFEAISFVVLPRALPGILAAILLSLGRAAGETIAVFLVVGRADNRLPETGETLAAILQPGQTITSKLGGSEVNIAAGDPLHTGALMSLALVLFLGVSALTLTANGARRLLVRKVST